MMLKRRIVRTLLRIEILLRPLRSPQRIGVRLELHDLAEEVVGFALPVGQGAGVVCVAGGVLEEEQQRQKKDP